MRIGRKRRRGRRSARPRKRTGKTEKRSRRSGMKTASLPPSAATVLILLTLGSTAFAQTTDIPQPAAGLFTEPQPLTKGTNLLERRVAAASVDTPSDGFFIDFSNMITGAGWISAGPGY